MNAHFNPLSTRSEFPLVNKHTFPSSKPSLMRLQQGYLMIQELTHRYFIQNRLPTHYITNDSKRVSKAVYSSFTNQKVIGF